MIEQFHGTLTDVANPGQSRPENNGNEGWLSLWHINPCKLFNAKSLFIQ